MGGAGATLEGLMEACDLINARKILNPKQTIRPARGSLAELARAQYQGEPVFDFHPNFEQCHNDVALVQIREAKKLRKEKK